MGFDQNDSRPVIHPSRKTTKVNLAMAAAVIVFLACGVVAIYWMKARHGQP